MSKICATCGKKIFLDYSEFPDGTTICRECNQIFQQDPSKIASKLMGKDIDIRKEGKQHEPNTSATKGIDFKPVIDEGKGKLEEITLKEDYGRGMQLILYLAGFFSSIICIIAGLDMTSIRSVSGNSVAEAYYNSVGVFVIGIGLFVGALLWGIASLIGKK